MALPSEQGEDPQEMMLINERANNNHPHALIYSNEYLFNLQKRSPSGLSSTTLFELIKTFTDMHLHNPLLEQGSIRCESLFESPKQSGSGSDSLLERLRTTLVFAGLLACLLLLVPYEIMDGIRVPKASFFKSSVFKSSVYKSSVFKPSELVPVFHFWVILIVFAFNGSFIGLKLLHKSRKLAIFCGYVALFTLILALGLLTLFTLMWGLDQI